MYTRFFTNAHELPMLEKSHSPIGLAKGRETSGVLRPFPLSVDRRPVHKWHQATMRAVEERWSPISIVQRTFGSVRSSVDCSASNGTVICRGVSRRRLSIYTRLTMSQEIPSRVYPNVPVFMKDSITLYT